MSFRSNAVFTHYMSVIQPKRHIAAPGCEAIVRFIYYLGLGVILFCLPGWFIFGLVTGLI